MNQQLSRLKEKRLLIGAGVFATLFVLAAIIFIVKPKPDKPVETDESSIEIQTDIVELSSVAIQQTDVTTFIVSQKPINTEIVTTGEVKSNQNRVYDINSFVGGRIIQDSAFLGDNVVQGQTLAVVQNLEVAKVNADFIHQLHQNEIDIAQTRTRLTLAQQNLEREKRLYEEGISPRKDYLQAQADATLAQSELRGQQEHAVHIRSEAKALLGAYGTRLSSPHSEQVKTTSAITSPRAGIITKKSITVGDMVTPEQVLYEVSDLSQMWLDIAVYPKDLNLIRQGQGVTFKTDSIPGVVFNGQVNYVQSAASEASQTFIARAYLNNSQGLLRPGMFGQVSIQNEVSQTKPFLPDVAIQTYGKETFVFKALGNHRFKKTLIQVGEKVSGGHLVNAGVKLGDTVVGKGSFTLKTELLKSQFAEEE